jgi:O-antigen/teichoic acid export membrane protein
MTTVSPDPGQPQFPLEPGPLGGAPEDNRDLGGLVRRGAAWQLVNVAFGRFGQLGLGIVIARILSPGDFGVYAVALVVYGIVVSLNELGVSNALIRGGEDPKSGHVVSSISLLTSGVLALAMAASSTQIATLLGAPKAASTVAVLSITVLLAGLTATPVALLRRDFRQDKLLRADVANTIVSAVVVLVLAYAGWGALALAWSRVAGQLVATVMLLWLSPERYRLGYDREKARTLLRFGLPLAAANGLSWMVINADYVVVSKVLGSVSLGFYLLAFNISGWPLNVFGAVVRAVALPAFGRLRNDPAAMSASLATGASVVAALTFPVCFMLGGLAQPLVTFLYGGRWHSAAAPLAALCVFAASRGLLDLLTEYVIALGRTRAVLVVQLVWLVSLVPSLIIGAKVAELAGVGSAQTLVIACVVLPVNLLIVRGLGVPLRPVLAACLPGLLSSVLAGLAAHVVADRFSGAFVGLLLGGLTGLAVYLGLMGRTLLRIVRENRAPRAESVPV